MLIATHEQEPPAGGRQTFRSSFAVRPFGHEDGRDDQHFSDANALSRHLDYLASLPRWELDLTDDRIEVDGVELTVKDRASGETIFLGGGWSPMIGGRRPGDAPLGDGLTVLRIQAEQPPEFGRWRKAE